MADAGAEVNVRASGRLADYAALVAALLLAALVAGRPELVALAAPFAVALAVALALRGPPQVRVATSLERERALEGEKLELVVAVSAEAAADVELELAQAGGLRPCQPERLALRLRAGETRQLCFELQAVRWGAHPPPALRVRSWGALALLAVEQEHAARGPLVRVYPHTERLRRLWSPLRTQTLPGARVARARGEGMELAEVRPFAPGDRARAVNWRASARLGALQVNQRHPERSADIVLLLDSFEHAGATLDQALRACLALAQAFLAARDRVGVVGFGGVLNWLEPAYGERARYRIADALIQTEVVFSYVWRTAAVIPPRLLPAGALVIGVSPLLDLRFVQALLDLRARGYDVAVLECAPETYVRARDQLAHRVWLAQREALRERLRALGVAVGRWREGEPLPVAIEEVREFRRRARARARI